MLFLNKSAEIQITRLKEHLPQALGLSGPMGVGLATIAKELAGKDIADIIIPKMADGKPDSLAGSIKVEIIRELYEKTRGKTVGRQVVVIDDADKMTIGAQNAFLKLLEEPHAKLHFILTTHRPERLLPTIRSRLQLHMIPRVESAQNDAMLSAFKIGSKKTQALFIADGLPAEMARLGADAKYFEKRGEQFRQAREFLTGSVYQKIIMINAIRERTVALEFCLTLFAILERSVLAKPDPALLKQIDSFLTAEEAILANGSVRLQLLRAVV